jgi:glycerophosphoryl diester phosphodiesterase
MQILAHRGWWLKPGEKNSVDALIRAVEGGFGVETDLRDHRGRLVIAHDPPTDASPPFRPLLDRIAACAGHQPTLALNIKADGLQSLVTATLNGDPDWPGWVFDMSVPETVHYLQGPIAVFVRQSEYEPEPVFYDRADGVWLDAFGSNWYDAQLIRFHLACGKKVALVSPELHGRPHRPLWTLIRELEGRDGWGNLYLCTDRPQEARRFFS